MLASSASLLPGFRSGCGLMARKGTKRFMHHLTSGSPAWSAGTSRCHSPPASQACAGLHSTKNKSKLSGKDGVGMCTRTGLHSTRSTSNLSDRLERLERNMCQQELDVM
jgi:hypothetical protein